VYDRFPAHPILLDFVTDIICRSANYDGTNNAIFSSFLSPISS
jgi:hypothetical protein